MQCKLCGKETSNEYCHECYWRAKWPEHILNSPELASRRKRSHKLKILELDTDKPEAVFQSVNSDDRIKGHTYTTTLTGCTCQDYAIGHGAYPCKHILRLAEELGLFENEHFARNESDYTLDNRYSNLPPQLINADDDALIEKYVTILHFIVRGREIRIRRLQDKLKSEANIDKDKISIQLKILNAFQGPARRIRQYKFSDENDELLDELINCGLIDAYQSEGRKTVDIDLPPSVTLKAAELILQEFKGTYPALFSHTTAKNPHAVLDDIINTHRRSELIIRPYDAKATPYWAFHVPEYFNDALDIHLVSRTKNLVEYAVWTQGVNFAFDTGDMIYRDSASHEKGTPALQVVSAKKALGTKTEKLNHGADSKIDSVSVPDNALQDKYYPGQVVYRDFENGEIKTVTQLDFVKMLIGGEKHEVLQAYMPNHLGLLNGF